MAPMVSVILAGVVVGNAAASGGLFSAVGGCQSALHNIASQGHSDLQLAAFCHASMPPRLCRDASGYLGAQPWSGARIASACKRWQAQWAARSAVAAEGRSAMDYASVQQTVNECMQAKAEAGLCRDANTSAPQSVNECIDWKQKVYPEKTKQIHDAISAFYGAAMGPSATQQKSEQRAPIPESSKSGRVSLGACLSAVLGLASLAVVGATVFKRVSVRRSGTREFDNSLMADTDTMELTERPDFI